MFSILRFSAFGLPREEKSTKEKFDEIYEANREEIINETPNFKPIILPEKEEDVINLFVQKVQEAFKEINCPYNKTFNAQRSRKNIN